MIYDTWREYETDQELSNMEKAAKKPEIQYFFETPYTAYCGECKRMITTGGVNEVNRLTCQWCGTPIDWTGWKRKGSGEQ